MYKYIYQLYFNSSNISNDSWSNYIILLKEFIGLFRSFELEINFNNNVIEYFLKCNYKLPISLNNKDFLIKETTSNNEITAKYKGIYISNFSDNIIAIYNKFNKKKKLVKKITFTFKNLNKINYHKCLIYHEKNNCIYKNRLLFNIPGILLNIDYNSNKSFSYKKIPKYLKIDKILHLLTNNKDSTLFNVDTFPYLDNNFYLRHDSYDFAKHSLVIGASGSGKSKFIALYINNISKFNKEKYKIVVIDPHDALKNDLCSIPNNVIIDFMRADSSVNLFKNNIEDINANVELMLSLFKSLINDNYNSKLERILRFSIYLLLTKNDFSFNNLKKLLLDLDYRNTLLNELKRILPSSVSYFFLTDFNEIKLKSYNESIAPIISFIDEMQMVPIFNEEINLNNIKDVINKHFLSVFSLNRLALGDKVTKTIAGFLMQQLFMLAQSQILDKHLIIIIDEVSVLENPILSRFLSELRKFNTSVILCGQYFNQISTNLKESILANTSNYYLFRVSKNDALVLENNLDLKLVNDDNKENRCNLLTNLKNRECLVRICKNDTLYPVFKARTMDYINDAEYIKNRFIEKVIGEEKTFEFNFTTSDIKVNDIMKSNSSSRRKV